MIVIDGEGVTKIHRKGYLYRNERHWLELMASSGGTPKILACSDQGRSITMRYAGSPSVLRSRCSASLGRGRLPGQNWRRSESVAFGLSRGNRAGRYLATAEILVSEYRQRGDERREQAGIMTKESEGYVYHCYGDEAHLRHAVASVVTLRRYDRRRAVALYCPPTHQALLQQHGLDSLFHVIGCLPDEACSIVGFKHNLHRFKPFDKCLYLDSDMVWCKNPDRLWMLLAPYSFTATGLNMADAYFGGPKGAGVFWDWIFNRRGTTMNQFGLTHLPRIQAGMIYAQDNAATTAVCRSAAEFLAQRSKTHFRSRLNEGRKEESCEWSLAMALSTLRMPIFPWFQGYDSPQLDFVEGLTEYEPAFRQVVCKFYCDRFVYSLRSLASQRLRDALLGVFSSIPGKGDFMEVTPFIIHFGSLRCKSVFTSFAARVWRDLVERRLEAISGARHIEADQQQLACA